MLAQLFCFSFSKTLRQHFCCHRRSNQLLEKTRDLMDGEMSGRIRLARPVFHMTKRCNVSTINDIANPLRDEN